jgi:hypothetical protein
MSGLFARSCNGWHARPVRLTSLEFLIIAAAVMLAFTPAALVMSRRQGARMAGVWVPAGIAGVYLWFWSLIEHVRWLAFAGVALIAASYAIQFAVRRSGPAPERQTKPVGCPLPTPASSLKQCALMPR